MFKMSRYVLSFLGVTPLLLVYPNSFLAESSSDIFLQKHGNEDRVFLSKNILLYGETISESSDGGNFFYIKLYEDELFHCHIRRAYLYLDCGYISTTVGGGRFF